MKIFIVVLLFCIPVIRGMDNEKITQEMVPVDRAHRENFLQLLPRDVLTSATYYFTTPAVQRDNREDYFVEVQENVVNYMKVLDDLFFTEYCQSETVNRVLIEKQQEFAKDHPLQARSDTFDNNLFELSLALKTPGSLAHLKRVLSENPELFQDLPYSKKNSALLMLMRTYPDEQIARRMFELGASVNAKSASGYCPLRLAIEINSLPLARLFMQFRAKPDLIDNLRVTPMMVAARNGQLDMVCCMLASGTLADVVSARGHTALGYAARGGHASIADVLIAHGSNPRKFVKENKNPLCDAVDGNSLPIIKKMVCVARPPVDLYPFLVVLNAALIRAVEKDRTEIAEFLLTIPQADPDLMMAGTTALIQAVRKNNKVLIKAFLSANQERSKELSRSIFSRTAALTAALKRKRVRAAQLLINDGGIDPLLEQEKYESPCFHALLNRDFGTLDILFEKAQLHVVNTQRVTDSAGSEVQEYVDPVTALLGQLLCTDKKNAIKNLLKKYNVRWDQYYPDGNTPLTRAIYAGDPAVIKVLLDAGASVRMRQRNGTLPIFCALESKNTLKKDEIIAVLLDAGADPNSVDPDGNTPLIIAASRIDGNDVVQILMAKGADSDKQNNNGEAALHTLFRMHLSVPEEQRLCSIITAEKKPLLDLRDSLGQTPLLLACKYGERTKLAEILIAAGANTNIPDMSGVTPLLKACRNNDEALAQSLLLAFANPRHKNNAGCDPLAKAARAGSLGLIQLLLKFGADIQSSKNAMLRAVAKTSHVDVAQCILKACPDINSRSTSHGDTPLMRAVKKQKPEMVTFLLKNGARKDLVNKKGETALEIATSLRDEKISKLLF